MKIILVVISYLSFINSLNVLIHSPAFATSHMNFMAHIADTLTDAGHNVTVLVPITEEKLRHRIGREKTKDIIIVEQDDEMRQALGVAPDADAAMKLLWKRIEKPEDMENNLKWIFDQILATCPLLLRNEKVMEELSSRKFDVAITESFSVCGMGLFKKLGIEKTILAASCAIFDFQSDFIGEPNHVSYVPTSNCRHGEKINFMERFMNYKSSDAAQKLIINHFDREIKYFKKFGISDWKELFPSASAYFINSNPYIDYPRPIIQKTVAIGGISVHLDEIKSQKLSEEWENILNLRKHNFLISFGSIAKSVDMPIEWRNNILNVIETFPEVTFIWKYESENLDWAKSVKNVKFVKWTPQTALLSDSRVSGFLTHGGLGSTHELAYLGKPSLMVPIFGDQFRNANMLARHNGSILLEKFSLGNFELLRSSINKLLSDPTYSTNAQKLAELLQHQPIFPSEQVVRQVEFIAKYGPFPSMDPYGRHLSIVQRDLIDIYAIIHISYILMGILVFAIFIFVFRLLLKLSLYKTIKNE